MFLNNNNIQLHMSILEQEEVEVVDQEDNKHRQIQIQSNLYKCDLLGDMVTNTQISF